MNREISDLLSGYGESDTAPDCSLAVDLFDNALGQGLHYNMLVLCCDDPLYDISGDLARIRSMENSYAGLSRHATICILPVSQDSVGRYQLHLGQDPDFYCLTYPPEHRELLIVARLCKTRNRQDSLDTLFSRYSSGFLYTRLLADLNGIQPVEKTPSSLSLRL